MGKLSGKPASDSSLSKELHGFTIPEQSHRALGTLSHSAPACQLFIRSHGASWRSLLAS